MTIKELLLKCQREKTAVLATNFYNFETLTAVMKAAQIAEAPVMLQLTRSSIDYMGIDVAVKMARQAITDYWTTAVPSNSCSAASTPDSTRS